jgi:hypothetical protein
MALHDLFIIPDLPDTEELAEGVEGLAWEHATLFAALADIEIGSDDFVDMHKDLLQRYREAGEHLAFIQHTAMRLLQALLITNRIALVIKHDETVEDVTHNLTTLSQIVTSCLMWVYAAYPLQWIPNNQWEYLDEEARGVDFPVTLPEGGERDDDNR